MKGNKGMAIKGMVRSEHVGPIRLEVENDSVAGMPNADLSSGLKVSGRCSWCGEDELYVAYHDREWGRMAKDVRAGKGSDATCCEPKDGCGLEESEDRRLFEFLLLEGAQAGLSWITVLRKREAYRRAFFDFDYRKVAAMTEDDVERLMQDTGIILNRLKIRAAIKNARLFSEIVDEYGSFYAYVMRFMPDGKRIVNDIPDMASMPVSSSISDALSRDMYRRGFRFFGTTICYSFLQATGFIDDHLNSCPYKGRR